MTTTTSTPGALPDVVVPDAAVITQVLTEAEDVDYLNEVGVWDEGLPRALDDILLALNNKGAFGVGVEVSFWYMADLEDAGGLVTVDLLPGVRLAGTYESLRHLTPLRDLVGQPLLVDMVNNIGLIAHAVRDIAQRGLTGAQQ